MAQTDRRIVKMNTPLATFKWPKLTEPDYGTKDFPKPDGEYSLKAVFDESDPKFTAFRAKMESYQAAVVKMGEAEFAQLKKPQRDKLKAISINEVFVPIYDENDEPTGKVEVKLTMKARGVVKNGARAGKKWERSPKLFDALGRPIKGKIEVWGGSEGIIAFSFQEDGYFIPASGACGIKLQLEAVQIVTLRQGGERGASDYGFGAHEDGFDGSQMQEKADDADGDDEFEGDENHLPAGDPEGGADF